MILPKAGCLRLRNLSLGTRVRLHNMFSPLLSLEMAASLVSSRHETVAVRHSVSVHVARNEPDNEHGCADRTTTALMVKPEFVPQLLHNHSCRSSTEDQSSSVYPPEGESAAC